MGDAGNGRSPVKAIPGRNGVTRPGKEKAQTPEGEGLAWYQVDFDSPEGEEVALQADGAAPPPEIPDAGEAERQLRSLRYWRGRRAEVLAHAASQRQIAQEKIEEVHRWEDEVLRPIERRIAWYEQGLFGFLRATGKKTLKLVNGVIKARAGKASVQVKDEEAFYRWCSENGLSNGLVRASERRSIDKVAVLAFIQTQGGELPDGVDLAPGETRFTVEVTPAGK